MQEKERTKKILQRYRNRSLEIIFKGIIENRPIREIHKHIADITKVFYNKYDFKSPKLYNYFIKLTKRCDKACGIPMAILISKLDLQTQKKYNEGKNTQEIEKQARAKKIVEELKKQQVLDKTNKEINHEANKEEENGKKKMIDEFLKQNRSIAKIFYLCSRHDDCAIDHIDYQGKVYIDETWRNVIKDEEERTKVMVYITEYRVHSFQWVTHAPVWMITRPNCRHYFKALDLYEVFGKSAEELIKEHNMSSHVGKRGMQTIKHPVNKGWYTIENIDSIIRKYKDRLDYLESLYRGFKSPDIKLMIDKTRFLLNKWIRYREQFNT